MSLPRTADVVVIGGGVVGVSIAYHLARLKAGRVVILERKQIAAGSTGMSSGLVRMHYDNPLEAEIALKSFEVFKNFDEIIGGDCGFMSTGFLRTVEPHNLENLKANVKMLQDLGVNTWLVTQDEIREIAPYLNADNFPIAAYEPESGFADPYLTTTGIANAARRLGASLFQGTEVTGITVEKGRVVGVETMNGRISTPTVVNAAGPWGAIVASKIGIDIELTAKHHQVAVVGVPPQIPWPHVTMIDRFHHIYFRPETGRLTLVGGSGSSLDRTIGFDELDTYSQSLTNEVRDHLLEQLCDAMPGMEHGTVRRGHAGIFTVTQDGHPILGPVPEVEGFYLAVGFSGHGFKEAPAVGQALAEWILHGKPEVVDITPLRPTRFREGQPYSGPHPYT